jgi:small subunit ribosomal protein S3
MGQKVNPHGLRLKIINDWKSRWFATKDYAKLLQEDIFIRKYLESRLAHAAISKIEIERESNQLTVDIHTARPGVVIGKKGSEVDLVRKEIEKRTKRLVQLNILEVPRPELEAKLVATNVGEQLIGRVNFKRAMKRAVAATMRSGAQGIKINVAGRLGGSEMARTEWYREGRVPLHTLKADIDYAVIQARTTFGTIGVKVWIYKGDVERKREFEVPQVVQAVEPTPQKSIAEEKVAVETKAVEPVKKAETEAKVKPEPKKAKEAEVKTEIGTERKTSEEAAKGKSPKTKNKESKSKAVKEGD